MSRFLTSILFLGVLFGSSTTVEAQEVTFTRELPTKGGTEETVGGMEMTMKLEVSQDGKVLKKASQNSTEREKQTKTYLAIGPSGPTKIRIEYGEMKKESVDSDEGKKTVLEPVSGKTFIVETKNDVLLITDGKGGKVGAKETEYLQKQYKDLGKGNEFEKWLHGKKVKIGETLNVPTEVAGKLFGGGDDNEDVTMNEFSLTLKSTKDEKPFRVAVFSLVMRMTIGVQDMFEMIFELKGTLLVGIDNCWPVSATIDGPIKIKNKSDQMNIKGGGKMKLTRQSTFGK